MSQQIGGYPPAPATGAPVGQPTGQPTTQVARDEAHEVGRTAVDAGRQVAGTAAEQAGNVAQEVKAQARDLVGEARGQVQDQARTGQQKAAEGVRSLSRELREMADGGQQSGTISEVARQAAGRVEGLATWLEDREPADLVEELRSFARRRPGAFLAGMAAAGVVVGRLTRGAVDSARADSAPRQVYGQPGYAGTPVPPSVSYDAPTPPQGYVAPRPYAPDAVGTTPLPAAAPAHRVDPLLPPVEPGPRYPSGTGGEYSTPGEYAPGENVKGGAPRRSDERLDDPFRPGGGEFR